MAGTRLNQIANETNVGVETLISFLKKKGAQGNFNANSKLSESECELIRTEFSKDKNIKNQSKNLNPDDHNMQKKQTVTLDKSQVKTVDSTLVRQDTPFKPLKVVGKIDLTPKKPAKQGDGKERGKEQHTGHNAQRHSDKQGDSAHQQSAATSKVEPAPANQTESQPTSQTGVQGAQPAESQAQQNGGEPEVFRYTPAAKLSGPTVLGKIDLSTIESTRSGNGLGRDKNKKRKRVGKNGEKVDLNSQQTMNQVNSALKKKDKEKDRSKQALQQAQSRQQGGAKQQNAGKKGDRKKRPQHQEITDEDVQRQVKDTLARLTSQSAKTQTSKHRRDKRADIREREALREAEEEEERMILKVTEFVTTNELAVMMDVPVNKVIATFMSLGMFVSINQRLDAESMQIVAEEFGYKVEFVSVETASEEKEEEDSEEDLVERPPIVTVMGHVDHGKTSLLDYIRKTNVIQGEAGGITQHIGAYAVTLDNGRQITFLDTPGHEAFTAMRARGAQMTDIAIIIVAADDSVMPQTVEAINHASAAGVPMVFAINKIDKPGANPDKIREALANMNYLVEEWGGKYQCQEIAAKKGTNVDKLLEKVILEADLLELKANPNRHALGNVIESSLDKGRGYVATLLVANGTLRVGDTIACGANYGRVKAMFNERNQRIEEAGPSDPVVVLGLNGAPQAGEKFRVYVDEREAKDVATKREQLMREQTLNSQPHLTLNEIGRRIALGNFQELNLIVKGDVDGSIEALADSFIRMSTEEINVNVIQKAVGAISENDVNLAAASNAIIIGFQVRPSAAAKKLADQLKIDIRLYSIIYDAIEDLKAAMEGMLSPEIREQVTGTLEVLEIFKISKVGTIAGCMVKEGKVKSKSKVRVIRDGIVTFTGALGSLKRFKDDVKEVVAGLDCGLNIENYNDIQQGDIVEAYEEIEVSRKL